MQTFQSVLNARVLAWHEADQAKKYAEWIQAAISCESGAHNGGSLLHLGASCRRIAKQFA